jgi:glycosyltransferase involved in cell wall biosynthesis
VRGWERQRSDTSVAPTRSLVLLPCRSTQSGTARVGDLVRASAGLSGAHGRRFPLQLHQRLTGGVPHSEVETAYAEASIFIFTSHRNTFGVQNLEAMSHGLPVVFRSSPGVSVGDFSGRGSIGVAPDAFPRLAAERIAHTIRDSSEWDRLSAGALAAAGRMTWSSKIERVVELFDQAQKAE